MKIPNEQSVRSEQLRERIREHLEELATATDAARMSAEMLRYLEVCSRFHQYSLHNIWLIVMSCPTATHVAGYHAWLQLKRFVRKGEKGIPILAPLIKKEEDENKQVRPKIFGFKVVHVFDVSQTDGEPLPEPPDWKSPEQDALLTERLMAFAEARGIKVTVAELTGEVQGVSKGGSIEISPSAGTATLVHEICHEMSHRGPSAPADRQLRELEAEAVAYVVCQHFGLETSGSPNYLAHFGISSGLLLEHLARITETAREIIESLNGHA